MYIYIIYKYHICYTVIFDIGSKLRYQYPHTYFILCITSQQLLSCKCLIPVVFACSVFLERYMRGTIKRDEQLKLYRTFLTFLAPTICFTFKHLRWCLFVGKPHGKPLHGQGLPIELVPVAGGPCTLALINVWWLYRWTKVSLPKWYFRCRSLFGNPNIIHIKPINDILFGPDVLKLAWVTMNMTSYPSEV